MNVTIEKKDALNATISVALSSNDYTPEVAKKLKDYQRKANIPGFRPGMAPKSMIEKMFGNSVLLEAVNTTASKGLFDFIDANQLNILGQPVLNNDSKIDELAKDKDYTFKFDIGLSPEFSLNISKSDVFTRYEVEVTDTQLEDEISRMKKRFGTLTDVEISGDNDMVYCSFTELDENNNPIEGGAHADNAPVLTSSLKDENLIKQFTGLKKEDILEVNIFTLFNHDEAEISHVLGIQRIGVSDLSPMFRLQVKDIKRNIEAEVNQELFDKAYGEGNITSLEDLKARLTEELKSYFNGQTEHLFEHELIDSLVEKHQIQLPDEFLKRWLIDRHADKFNTDNVEHGYLHEAEYLRNHLFEEKVLSENNAKIEEADIKQAALNYTRQMFGAYGNAGISDEMLESIVEPSMKKEDYRSRMINLAVSQKVRTLVKDMITIETKSVSVDEFNKLITDHNHKHHAHNH
jgi:trigger factor